MSCPSPSKSEVSIFDDFEDADEMTSTSCSKVSEEEYEKQMVSTTDAALGELCQYLEQNPEVYARVLRKRKKEEMESSSVLGFMKSKVMSLMHGENVPESLLSTEEVARQTQELKTGMCKVFQHSQEINGRTTRHSERISAKRQARMKTPLRPLSANTTGLQGTSLPAPPASEGKQERPRCPSCTAELGSDFLASTLEKGLERTQKWSIQEQHQQQQQQQQHHQQENIAVVKATETAVSKIEAETTATTTIRTTATITTTPKATLANTAVTETKTAGVAKKRLKKQQLEQ